MCLPCANKKERCTALRELRFVLSLPLTMHLCVVLLLLKINKRKHA